MWARMRGINEAIHGEQHEVILGTVKGPDDAAYIAALDPATVKKLCDVVEAVRGHAHDYAEQMEGDRCDVCDALSRLDEGKK